MMAWSVALAACCAQASVDVFDRAAVSRFYFENYLPGQSVPLLWDGDLTACRAGTNNRQHQEATLARANFYRAMAGVSSDLELANDWNNLCAEAALLVSRNDQASHNPTLEWACYSPGGAEAASRSLLYLGREGPAAIDGYMDDPGAENYFVGHRRWLLYPPQRMVGVASIPQHLSFRAANAFWVVGGSGARSESPKWVAWPPAGFIPYQILPRRSGRWSFSCPSADFSQARVTVSLQGSALHVEVEPGNNDHGYADNTLVWIPEGIPLTPPESDLAYEVTITGVSINGTQTAFRYASTIIDPSRAPASLPPNVAIQPQGSIARAHAPVDFEIRASGAPPLFLQWRQDAQAIAGATNNVLSIPSVMPWQAGVYDVVITNVYGAVTSAPASLTVLSDGWIQCRKEGDSTLLLFWEGEGVLQRAPDPHGPWNDEPQAASPYVLALEGNRSFFRLRAP